MGKRLDLQAILAAIPDVKQVYFQPPETLAMQYPCIRYKRSDENVQYASNRPYTNTKRYQVMVIDQDPDTAIPDVISSLPKTRFSRFYTAEGLNHFIYELYF